MITLKTTLGEIVIELDHEKAPKTCENFEQYVRDGHYDGTIFHRVIVDFMAQGGDPTGTGTGGPGYRFRDEFHEKTKYNRGTVAMANAGPNTNGSQFFITVAPTTWLTNKHTIFGEVADADSRAVVDAIASVSPPCTKAVPLMTTATGRSSTHAP